MALWDDTLDLGARDYDDEDDLGIDQFLVPPPQAPYPPSSLWKGQAASGTAPSPDVGSPQMPDQGMAQGAEAPAPPPPGAFESPFGELDAYQTLDQDVEFRKNRYEELNRSASAWEKRLSDFKETKPRCNPNGHLSSM